MSDETKKSTNIRKEKGYDLYFNGRGIDIGCGSDILDKSVWTAIEDIQPYDLQHGDANKCDNLEDETYDFVYSSHCLEHMHDPKIALGNWLRITKSGGYVIFAVPHEIFYEKCNWPSRFNPDHKTSWALEFKSNMPKSVFVPDFLKSFDADVILCETNLINFDFNRFGEDQTRGKAICQIDVVLRKR